MLDSKRGKRDYTNGDGFTAVLHFQCPFRPRSMIIIVHIIELDEYVNHFKNHVHRIPIDIQLKHVYLQTERLKMGLTERPNPSFLASLVVFLSVTIVFGSIRFLF